MTVYGLGVFAVLVLTGLTVARRIARPIGLLHEGVQKMAAWISSWTSRPVMKSNSLPMPSTKWRRTCACHFEQIEHRMEDVRRLEARYRDLIEHSPEMIYQLNKAGNSYM